jgi:hypothetical protein
MLRNSLPFYKWQASVRVDEVEQHREWFVIVLFVCVRVTTQSQIQIVRVSTAKWSSFE